MARVPAPVQARRLLALLHLFEPDAEIPLSVIAQTMGTTEAEAARDLELLSCCGASDDASDLIPVYVEDGVVTVFNPLPTLDRPVRLSAGEARALSLALHLAGVESGDPLLSKLDEVSALDDVSDEELEKVLLATAAGEVGERLKDISVAIDSSRLLELEYLRAGDSAPSSRVVEPMAIVQERGVWYVEGFCRSAGALRTFRLDRIRRLTLREETFTRRELAANGAAFVSDGLPVATIRLAPEEDFDAREWPGARMIEQEADGSVLVSVPYGGTGWIARQVAARLGRATVIEPAEIRDAVASLARADVARLS